MKKYILPILSICLFSMYLVSCASIDHPTQRLTSDDCLVIIPTTLVNNYQLPTARDYFFHFSNYPSSIKVIKDSKSYIAISVNRDDVLLLKLTSNIGENSVTGKEFKQELSIPLPYKRGEVIVADFTFEQVLTRIDARTMQSSYDFVDTKPEIREYCLERFLNSKYGNDWTNK